MPDLIIKSSSVVARAAQRTPLASRPLRYDVDGAIITEALDSDASNIIGLDRKDAVKRWIVRCPYIDDKPTKYLQIVFPQGQTYEVPRKQGIGGLYDGLLVYGYDEGERIGVQEWHSSVIYRTADELATLGWVGEGEFSEEQEHIRRDESEVYARDSAGNFVLDASGNKIRIGYFIGHRVYKPVERIEGASLYYAQGTSGEIALFPTNAFKIIGIDRYRSIHRFSMTRVLTELNWYQVRQVGALVWTVNDLLFLGYLPGELAFSNFSWREVFGALLNAPLTQKQYEVRLQFSANPNKWSPVRIGDTYTDEEGFESDILVGNEQTAPAFADYLIYRTSSFSSIFNLLNTTAPR